MATPPRMRGGIVGAVSDGRSPEAGYHHGKIDRVDKVE